MSEIHDAEMLQFMADLELSLQQAKAGEFVRVHTPAQIAARCKTHRPQGNITQADQSSAPYRAAHR